MVLDENKQSLHYKEIVRKHGKLNKKYRKTKPILATKHFALMHFFWLKYRQKIIVPELNKLRNNLCHLKKFFKVKIHTKPTWTQLHMYLKNEMDKGNFNTIEKTIEMVQQEIAVLLEEIVELLDDEGLYMSLTDLRKIQLNEIKLLVRKQKKEIDAAAKWIKERNSFELVTIQDHFQPAQKFIWKNKKTKKIGLNCHQTTHVKFYNK